jgi:SAM-dependent methyltransferase
MHDLHYEQFAHFINLCNLEKKTVVEIGCGGGEIMAIASELPIEVFGIEHSHALVTQAKQRGLNVEEGYIDSETYLDARGPFDAFISINNLEHQPNPRVTLRGIRHNLTADGVGLITVPSFDYLLSHSAYYELMRDHIAYYDVASLSTLLENCGFSVVEVSTFNNDTISVIIKKRPPVGEFGAYCKESFTKLNSQIHELISQCAGNPIAVWGASHQCFTFLSTLGLDRHTVSYIVDSANFKWGCISPGTHIPIVSPLTFSKDCSVHGLLIIAPGFSEEIASTALKLRPDISFITTLIDGQLRIIKGVS